MEESEVPTDPDNSTEESVRRKRTKYLWAVAPVILISIICIIWGSLRSPFDGEWIKKSGEATMPDSLRISVTKGTLHETFGLALPQGPYQFETVHVLVDGQRHPWTGDWEGWSEKQYVCTLTHDSFLLTKYTKEFPYSNEQSETERWILHNRGKELIMSRSGQDTTYVRVSWFRSAFVTNAP